MATPKVASPREAEENKRKQAYLKANGYPNLAADGSWGPWLEQAWIKATTRLKLYPVSPWGLIQRGLDNLTGNTTYRVEHPEGEIRQAPKKDDTTLAGAAAIGLRDPRAVVAAVPLAMASALWMGNGPEIMQSVSGAGQELKQGALRVYNKLSSYFYPEESPTENSTEAPANAAPAQESDSATAAGGSPEPERNDSTSQRRSFRERLGDRIAGRRQAPSGNQPSRGGNTPPNNEKGPFLGRMLWETKGNNFGQNWWQWRNVGRVGLSFSYPAREHVWPNIGSGIKYMTVGPDSIPTAPQKPAATTITAPVDSNYIARDLYIAPTDTLDF